MTFSLMKDVQKKKQHDRKTIIKFSTSHLSRMYLKKRNDSKKQTNKETKKTDKNNIKHDKRQFSKIKPKTGDKNLGYKNTEHNYVS